MPPFLKVIVAASAYGRGKRGPLVSGRSREEIFGRSMSRG